MCLHKRNNFKALKATADLQARRPAPECQRNLDLEIMFYSIAKPDDQSAYFFGPPKTFATQLVS
jgi:hypothetical protein